MTSPFECLPAEVFDIVAAYLDLPGHQTLRLTSQRLHLLSLSSFKKRYFAKLITTLGSPSLDRLLHVATHTHLSPVVTTLEIRLLNHRDYKDLTKIARIGIFPPPKRFPKVSCVRTQDMAQEATLYDDVLANRQSKCITDRLSRSLARLPNLSTLRIRAHHPEPLGWEKVAIPDGDCVFRTRCVRAVLDAMMLSGPTLRLQTLSLAKEKGHTPSKLLNAPYPALQLSLDLLQRLRAPLATLQHLSLSVMAAQSAPDHHHHRLPGWENSLPRFVACAPALTFLTLSLDRKTCVSEHGARIVRALSDSLRLEHLETLHLCNASAHESDVAKLVKTHAQTLSEVGLGNVRLLTGKWSGVFGALKAVPGLATVRFVGLEGGGRPGSFRRRRDRERRKMVFERGKEGGLSVGEGLDELVRTWGAEAAAGGMYGVS
ncbi:hypothetical protein SVAN01_00664 [Stagonosporopsis vannaccii]|nr:hypothetical protein SVAN01_00664 [Stagonosporopsis vannaccii]